MNAVAKATGADLELKRGTDGRLWATVAGHSRPVGVRRCFPWSGPDWFVSLTDERGRECLLIQDPQLLDARSRALLELELATADFLLRITGIEAIVEEIEVRAWTVRTGHGRRRFQTQRDEWPRSVPGAGVLIRDVAGDLYCIPRVSELDAASRRRLSAYID